MRALTIFALFASTAAAAHPYAVDVDVGRLSRGEIVGVVDVPVEEALAIVMDCDQADVWFPDMLDTDVVSVDGDVIRCAGATNLPWPVPDRTWQIDSEAHLEVVDGVETWVAAFDYVEGTGNLDVLRGRYLLQRAGAGQTLVRYEAFVDLGFWIPEPLVNWATRRILPGILMGMEAHAETRMTLATL